jgi:cytochrome c oxidase cbb3-type subunit 4
MRIDAVDLVSLQPLFSTLWVVWFFILFVGILIRVMAPGRKRMLDQAGLIPFREDHRDRRS